MLLCAVAICGRQHTMHHSVATSVSWQLGPVAVLMGWIAGPLLPLAPWEGHPPASSTVYTLSLCAILLGQSSMAELSMRAELDCHQVLATPATLGT